MRRRSRFVWGRRLGACLVLACTVLSATEGRAEPIATRQLAEGVTFEVNALRRINDKVLQLDFALVNGTGKELRPEALGLAESGWMNGVHLLDMQNLKVHKVGLIPAVGYLCSKAVAVPANGRQVFYAQYAAPPARVAKLAIQFPVAPPLFDIPINP